LKEKGSREVQDNFKVEGHNRRAIKILPKKIKKDKRKKEWILLKKDEEIYLVKVLKKTNKLVITEYWKKDLQQNEETEIFIKCNRCKLGNYNDNICSINLKYENWYQVVEVSKKENILRLKALVTVLTNKKDIIEGERLSQEVNIEITISNLESTIIQRLVEDKNMQNDLINLNHKLKGKKNTEFYTDSMLVANRDSENINRMGIGWVFKEGNE